MGFEPDEVDLSILFSFPRSGSNFLQNVVKANSKGIHCTSAYANGVFLRARSMLKSHATDEAGLEAEMRTTWQRTKPRSCSIVLLRDPRDLMISYYDFMQKMFADEIDPDTLFDYDYRWLKAEYRARVKTGVFSRHEDRADAGAPIYSVADALRDWASQWVRPREDASWLTIRFEDLVSAPTENFGAVFDHLKLPKPDAYQDLGVFVSLHGDSTRPRGKAMGWAQAPDLYRPILERAAAELGPVIAHMGYDAV